MVSGYSVPRRPNLSDSVESSLHDDCLFAVAFEPAPLRVGVEDGVDVPVERSARPLARADKPV